jgi:hypothetical protein
MTPFNRLIQTKNADHVLRLYIIELVLYEMLQKDNNASTTLLFLYSKTLANRVYKGCETFRAMIIIDTLRYQKTLNDYRWPEKNSDYVLETRDYNQLL